MKLDTYNQGVSDYRTCATTGLRGYASAKASRNASRTNRKRIRVFLCPLCSLWHVTNEPKRHPHARQKRRERKKLERPAKTPQSPRRHKFLAIPGDENGEKCFVCGMHLVLH